MSLAKYDRRAPFRILCVEDNDPDFELVSEYLGQASRGPSYRLSRAEDLTSAKESLSAADEAGEQFDIILSDLSLPDSKGKDTFIEIQEAAPNVPIAVLTGLEDDDLGLYLVKLGAQDYLPKDHLSPEFLIRSLHHAVERKRNQVEMQRLNAELKLAQLQLIQAEKLESLGRLSGGVAHEIKNPLAVLQAGVDYYDMHGRNSPEEVVICNSMQDAITRATRIVSGMLDFSRGEKLELKLAAINQLVRCAVDLVEPDMRRAEIHVVIEANQDIPDTEVDPGKIEQVLVNLLSNALHASSEGDQIRIRTFRGSVDNLIHDDGLRTYRHLRSGDEVVVAEVRDYGSGIPADKISKIFDPFFTTKATGIGTGLGLSVSKTIVDLHGGLLRILNIEEPQGVSAQVILPAKTVAAGQDRPGEEPTVNLL